MNITGGCLACGGPLVPRKRLAATDYLLRYIAGCEHCGRLWVLTVTMRAAEQRDIDPWADDTPTGTLTGA